MSWLNPSDYEQALLENAQQNWPEIVELAQYAALSPRIEPLLLRNMRVKFLPGSEPELEHHLWFSALASARSTRNIVLHQGVARLLADQLQQNNHFDIVWKSTQDWTAHWNALDRLEQQLRVAALLNDQQRLNKGLQDILKLITQTDDEESRLNLARWTKKTLPAIATETNASEEIAWLAQYAASALGATAGWTRLSSTAPLPDWLANAGPLSSASFGQTTIGLQLRYDSDTDHQVLECLAAEDAAMTLDLPTPLPARLYILSEHQTKGRWEVIDVGSRIKIQQISHRIELCTINGDRFELLAEFDTTPSSASKAKTKLYLTYIKEDHDIAENIARELEQQKINVTLIQEEPGDKTFASSQDTNARLLRLWTPAAQLQWSTVNQDAAQTHINSLLIRMDQATLPTGTNPAQIIDWDQNANLVQKINRWLEDAENPKPEHIQENETDKLLKELENPETKPRRRLVIGDILTRMGDPRPGVGVKEFEVFEYPPEIQRLLDELNDINTEPPRRLEIGDELAKLGDPRPGVGLDEDGLPDIDWVEIPAGEFIYGEKDSQQTLTLEKFHISRYPITNSQFQAFIDAGGYNDKRWWQDLKKPSPKEPSWSQSNRSRERVDWYEAVAFTRWLSAQLGYHISLPKEQQWEKAARGTDGREYPWGNTFKSGFANLNDQRSKKSRWYLEQTTAVGAYPQSNSPYQQADMAGNVDEWCLNKYDSPEEIGTDSSGNSRVMRGGSWPFNPEFARCAGRSGGVPDDRDSGIGFRVVCSSPFTDH